MIPKRTTLTSWDGSRLPEIGEYFKTAAGSMYLIIGVKPNTRPNPKSVAKCDLLKLSPDDIAEVPDDAVIHGFRWNSRNKQT